MNNQQVAGRESILVTKITVNSDTREAFRALIDTHCACLHLKRSSTSAFSILKFIEENFQELFSCAEWKMQKS